MSKRSGDPLFVEKEGFAPLLNRARVAERYDLAIMSTKGMSVTASRELVEKARMVAEEALENSKHEEVDVPPDLDARVRAYLVEHPEQPWDAAVEAIVSASDE